jgi:hypothetical protein
VAGRLAFANVGLGHTRKAAGAGLVCGYWPLLMVSDPF